MEKETEELINEEVEEEVVTQELEEDPREDALLSMEREFLNNN